MFDVNGASSASRGWMHRLSNPSDTGRHYLNVSIVLVLFIVAQLLTCAWDQPFRAYDLDFPGQIVAMVFVWLAMWTVQAVFFEPGRGLERIYNQYLRHPTDVLNKHMSIGFTIPFLNLISQPFAGADQVGLLTAAFLVTGVLNAILVYVIAYHVQVGITKATCWRWPWNARVEKVLGHGGSQKGHNELPTTRPGPTDPQRVGADVDASAKGDCYSGTRADRFRKHISDASTLCTLSGYNSDSNTPDGACGDKGQTRGGLGRPGDALHALERTSTTTTTESPTTLSSKLLEATTCVSAWIQHNVFLTTSILVFLIIGIPLSCHHYTDLPLDTAFLFTIWLTFTSAQARTKAHTQHHHHHHHLSSNKPLLALATLLNPVLWTSLSLICYGLAKAHIRGETAAAIVSRFKTNTTLSDLIAQHTTTTATTTMGAGDIATSILNAGIVSWGLKLFEYRARVLSRGGAAVLLTSALSALLNVVAWPLLARALGVAGRAAALSFAARSVTIALGGPAMQSLGGDAALNAVGVVVNGICFQLVAGVFGGGGGGGRSRRGDIADVEAAYRLNVDGEDESTTTTTRSGGSSSSSSSSSKNDDDIRTVAAGVTVGINAAAMGTAHLYERHSASAPYSALSMTVFGVFTVLFTVKGPMVEWLVAMVS